MVVAAVGVGLLGAFGAVLFRLLIRSVQAVAFEGPAGLIEVAEAGLFVEPEDPLETVRGLPWFMKILIPATGGLIVGPLIYFYAREARGHGVPEVMKAVAIRGGIIRPRIVAIKALASALSIGTGGSVGREGPIVQIGSAIGSSMGQILKLNTTAIRTLVGCGAAAGVSATFNAPIAGAIFAAEIVVGNFAVTQFMPIVISSVVATVVSRFFLGNHPAFPVPSYEIVSPFELLPYMATGVVAGLVGVAFILTLASFEQTFERVPIPEWSKATLGGALVGVIALQLPEVMGVGYTSISGALAGTLSALTMGWLVLAKILATSITIGSGGSGGVFAPSLFLGAMSGGVLGTLVENYFPGATASSGAYALVTMGAVVAATTHAPISAILIIFELTQTIDIIPALMTACVLSTLVSQLLHRESIYTSKLKRSGVDLYEKQDPNVLRNLYVRDVIDDTPDVIPESANFQTILDLVVQSHHSQFFVTNASGELLGSISLQEVRRLIYEQDSLKHLVVARDLVDTHHPVVSPDDDLQLVTNIFSSGRYDELAVVEAAGSRRMIGTVRQRAVIEAANQEQLRRDLAGSFTSSVDAAGTGTDVDLGGGYLLREIPTLPFMENKTPAELHIRERTGVQVLLVRSGGRSGTPKGSVCVPDGHQRFQEGDTLVVAGSTEGLRSLEHLGSGG